MNRNVSKLSSLVSTKWLAEKIASKKPNLAVLDGSWHMPTAKRDPKAEFLQKHIPSAQFFGIDECCAKNTDLEHMLPTKEAFSDYVGSLGIDNNTRVVVYDNHKQFGLFSAQRVWWTFRVFGHDLVSVVNGGLNRWIHDGYETTSEITSVTAKKFHVNFRSDLVKNFEDMQRNLIARDFTVIDARSAERFTGMGPEPRQGLPSGHMPGAINIPFTHMFDSKTKLFKSPQELQEVFESAGIDLRKPLVSSCGSGMTACTLAFAAFQLGKENVAVYDGSWLEYAQRSPAELIFTNTCTKK